MYKNDQKKIEFPRHLLQADSEIGNSTTLLSRLDSKI